MRSAVDLPHPRGAEDGDELALPDLEGEIVECVDGAGPRRESLGDSGQFDSVGHGVS